MQVLCCRARQDSQFLAQQLAWLVGGKRGCGVTAGGEGPRQQLGAGLGERGVRHQAACRPFGGRQFSPPCPSRPRRWFQRFDNLLAKVVTRPGPDNRWQEGRPMTGPATAPGAGGSRHEVERAGGAMTSSNAETYRAGHEAFNQRDFEAMTKPIEQAIAIMMEEHWRSAVHPDRAEGIGAFNEGREPNFSDPDY
jgi:hypothetical protein